MRAIFSSIISISFMRLAMTRTRREYFTLLSALVCAAVDTAGGVLTPLHGVCRPRHAVSEKRHTSTCSNDDQDLSVQHVLNKYSVGIRGGSASPIDQSHYGHNSARRYLLGVRGGSSFSSDDPDNYNQEVWDRFNRFVRATRGDEALAQKRYQETEAWRKANGIDSLLTDPHPQFTTIKQNYPHYYHGRGHRGEPVYYELPAKINLKELKRNDIDLSGLLRHYLLVTDFCWTVLERSQHGPQSQSIYVLDLEGIKLKDFVGDVVKFVKEAASLTAQHYPERSGGIFVINAPVFFDIIWKVIKPIVDPSTLEKVKVIRGKDKILAALRERIPLNQIPPEYGGRGLPLGHSEEERYLGALMQHNTYHHHGDMSPAAQQRNDACEFCYQAALAASRSSNDNQGAPWNR